MIFNKKNNNSETMFKCYFNVLNNWLKIKNMNRSFQTFFDCNYIKTVAIYGMGELGKRLYEELKLLNVDVLYGIDKNAKNLIIDGLDIITLEDSLPKVDIIIITPVHYFEEIEKDILKKGDYNLVSLEEMVVTCL